MKRAPVLLATLTAAALLLAGCGSDAPPAATPRSSSPAPQTSGSTAPTATPTAQPSTSPTTSSPAPPASPDVPADPAAGKFIDYENVDESGVIITRAADTARLTGAPADFKTFIAAELARSRADLDKECPENPQIYVSRLATGGWAAGGYFIPQCGGYAALWASSQGSWKQVWTGQELVGCATLTKYAFPASVSGTSCLEGDKSVKYPRR